MLKKFLSVVMVGAMVLSLTACGGGNNPGKFTKMPSGKQGYLLNDNSYAKSMWVTHSGKEYYFNSAGELCTNQYVDGKLVDAKGAMIKKNNEFFNFVNGKTYFVKSDGVAADSGIYEVKGEKYALKDGYFAENYFHNWSVDESYYFGAGGKQVKTGGIYINNSDGRKIVIEDGGRILRGKRIVNVGGVDYVMRDVYIVNEAGSYYDDNHNIVFADSEGKVLKAKNEYAIVKCNDYKWKILYYCIDEQGHMVKTGELDNTQHNNQRAYIVRKKDGSVFCHVNAEGEIVTEYSRISREVWDEVKNAYTGYSYEEACLEWRIHNTDDLNADYDLTK